MDHSWWIIPAGAFAIVDDDKQALWELLLKPPHKFCLMLVELGVQNLIQLAMANEVPEVKATTPLAFTLQNVPLSFTVYELDEASRGSNGTEPGVQALLRFLGPRKAKPDQEPEKPRTVGRPKNDDAGGREAENRIKRTVRPMTTSGG